jgi:hypothetical protein
MPDSPRTIVGQFSTSGGQSLGRAANVRAVEPAAELPEHERGKLYMLVEVTGAEPGHTALYRQMLNAAQAAFYDGGDSQASALTRAIRNAHSVLVNANQALAASWQAGITLAALDGWNLTIAQAGPALCLVSHPKTVEQFPGDVSAWTQPFGGPERPDVKIFETRVEPGSMVLLAQSNWLNQVTPEQLAVASTAENVSIATAYLGQIAGGADLSALVTFIGAPGAESVAPPAPDVTTAPAPELTETVPPAAKGALLAGVGARLFGRSRPAETAAPPPPVPPPPEPPPPEVVEAEPGPEPEPAMAAAVTHEYPTEHAAYEEVVVEKPRRSPWPLVIALILIPLLVAGLVFAMWWLRAREVEAQFQQTLDGASAAVTGAAALSDEEEARLRLNTAREFLDKARATHPDDPRLQDVQNRYQEQLERVNHITPIYGIVPLWDFKGEGQDLSRVIVSGDSLYVLDKGRNEVHRFVLSPLKDSVTPMEDEKPVLYKGQQVDNALITDFVDMTWVDATGNQRSRLLSLDAARNLFSYDVTWGPAKVPLASPERLGAPQLTSGYNGNLYVTDGQAGQVWRYRPGQNGYENAPEGYFPEGKTVGMDGLQEMAIDGSIWLLFSDNRLLKFLGGVQQPFELSGLPDPMSAPSSMTIMQAGDKLYVADAGNARILEFDKNGNFQRQLWAREGDALKDMRSIFLDETTGALFILTGDRLYKAPIPEQAAVPSQ